MISEGPAYDETVSSYSCQRNDPLLWTPPLLSPIVHTTEQSETTDAWSWFPQHEEEKPQKTKLAQWCGAGGLRGQVRKTILVQVLSLNEMLTVAKKQFVSLGLKFLNLTGEAGRHDGKGPSGMFSTMLRLTYFPPTPF